MGFRVVTLFVVLPLVTATTVEMKSEWKENFGWQIACSWKLYNNDTLQSVRLYNKGDQFMIYRPETDGPQRTHIFRLHSDILQVDCAQDAKNKITGICVITLELYEPQKEDLSYTCEVSGEKPYFRLYTEKIDIPALIPPSPAVIKVIEEQSKERITLNCSSTGVPAPGLRWTVSDQREPQAYSNSYWNSTSKLWHVWSLLVYIPAENQVSDVVCTPEVNKSNKTYTGLANEYNSAHSIGTSTVFLSLLNLLILLC